jgi:hypothetical protein
MTTSAERMRRLRERQKAALEPVPDAVPRDPDELLVPAVEQTIAALKLGERDGAVGALALRYAASIDAAADPAAALRYLGPLLHKALESLGASPASRKGAAVRPERSAPSRLAQLRAAHMETKRRQGRGS